MPKVIHEFWHTFETKHFSHYELRVEKETEKMLYGTAYSARGSRVGKFSAKKDELNLLKKLHTMKIVEYRIQIDVEDAAVARDMAKEIFYNHFKRIADAVIDTDLGGCA